MVVHLLTTVKPLHFSQFIAVHCQYLHLVNIFQFYIQLLIYLISSPVNIFVFILFSTLSYFAVFNTYINPCMRRESNSVQVMWHAIYYGNRLRANFRFIVTLTKLFSSI